MEIRPLTQDDHPAHQHIVSLAFGRGRPQTFTTEIYGQTDRQRLGLFSSGRLQSCLGILDFDFDFQGDHRPCGGIFGVASDPAARGRGYASALIVRALETMRERGQYLSS